MVYVFHGLPHSAVTNIEVYFDAGHYNLPENYCIDMPITYDISVSFNAV